MLAIPSRWSGGQKIALALTGLEVAFISTYSVTFGEEGTDRLGATFRIELPLAP
jgi:hypothetical protein